MARVTDESDVSVVLLLSVSESAAAPSLEMPLLFRLQRGNGGSGMLLDSRPEAQSCGRDLPERHQSLVALERLRERRGALVLDPVAVQAGARKRRVRDARTGPQAERATGATYLSNVRVLLLLSASENAAAPASLICSSFHMK
jgi:hypothetical protein